MKSAAKSFGKFFCDPFGGDGRSPWGTSEALRRRQQMTGLGQWFLRITTTSISMEHVFGNGVPEKLIHCYPFVLVGSEQVNP